MRVEVVRRGGLAGLTLRGAAVDTATLPRHQAAAAEAALAGLPFDRALPAPPHPDALHFEIAVGQPGARRVATLYEHELPDALRPIVEQSVEGGKVE